MLKKRNVCLSVLLIICMIFIGVFPKGVAAEDMTEPQLKASGASTISGNVSEFNLQTGVAGVTIKLCKADGTQVSETTSDASGNYSFSQLEAGLYYMEFQTINGYEFFYSSSPDASDAFGGDKNGGATSYLNIDGTNSKTNINIYLLKAPSSIISGQVKDQSQQAVAGVDINLYGTDGSIIKTVQSDANGNYKFDQLEAGDYYMSFKSKPGYDFWYSTSPDNNAYAFGGDKSGGSTGYLTLDDEDSKTDIVIYLNSDHYISGKVVDVDTNEGVAGVKVTLYDLSGQEIASTTSGADGTYQFNQLTEAAYYMTAVMPDGYTFVWQSPDPFWSSDGQNASTGYVYLDSEGKYEDGTIHVKKDKPKTEASISGTVFDDTNKNGVMDAGEKGIANVGVELRNSNREKVATAVTDANGCYQFDHLGDDDYIILIGEPAGYDFESNTDGIIYATIENQQNEQDKNCPFVKEVEYTVFVHDSDNVSGREVANGGTITINESTSTGGKNYTTIGLYDKASGTMTIEGSSSHYEHYTFSSSNTNVLNFNNGNKGSSIWVNGVGTTSITITDNITGEVVYQFYLQVVGTEYGVEVYDTYKPNKALDGYSVANGGTLTLNRLSVTGNNNNYVEIDLYTLINGAVVSTSNQYNQYAYNSSNESILSFNAANKGRPIYVGGATGTTSITIVDTTTGVTVFQFYLQIV